MCLLNKFCCCGLRTGCFVIGALSIVIALLNITWLSYIIYVDRHMTPKEVYLEQVFPDGISIGIDTVFLITAVILIRGADQRRKSLLLPWMVMAITFCVLLTVGLIFSISELFQVKRRQLLGYIVSDALEITLMIYCLIAVRSFYNNSCQEYKELGKVSPS